MRSLWTISMVFPAVVLCGCFALPSAKYKEQPQIVNFTDQLTERYVERGAKPERITVVLNGADPESVLACAPAPQGPRPVNVAAVRHEISDAIGGDRKITAVGHVTEDRAIVYTANASNARAEETWVRGPDGWKLDHAAAMSSL